MVIRFRPSCIRYFWNDYSAFAYTYLEQIHVQNNNKHTACKKRLLVKVLSYS